MTEHAPSAQRPPSLAGSSGVLLGARIGINLGYFGAAVILAHLLHPVERGAVAFITVTALVVSTASRVGFDDTTSVFVASRVEQRPRLLANALCVGAITSTFVGGAAALVLLALPQVRPERVDRTDLLLLALGGMSSSVGVCGGGYLIGCRRFLGWSLANVTTSWGYTALLVALAVAGKVDVTRAAIAWTLSQALGAVVAVIAAVRVAGIRRPSRALLRTTLPFAFRAWVGSFSSFLNARLDQTIMGIISTERSLGIYAVAVNAGEIALYLPGAVATALLPVIASSPPERRLAQTTRVARALLLLTFATVVAAAVGGFILIPLVFGSSYTDSVVPFLWLLPGAVGYAGLRVFSSALLAAGSPARSSLGSAAALVTGVVLDFALIPVYGADGAAIAATVAFMAGGVFAVVVHRKTTNCPWRELLPRRADLQLIAGLARRIASRQAVSSKLAGW
ncbi:MAG TPA: oligosaccharide flippase family protein [Gaiellaceae bacterium]|nr:oligosaccharide flippase family protein [Gaiellaceae bacterium]